MSIEPELLRLAGEREEGCEAALVNLRLDPGDQLRRLRAYLLLQEDRRRIKRFENETLRSRRLENNIDEVACTPLEFRSESSLTFKFQMEQQQPGWRLARFQFHLHLPARCSVRMIRIHLNDQRPRDHLAVPRSHMHIGSGDQQGRAHIPFPVMSPLLIVHLLCEVIEPDLSAQP